MKILFCRHGESIDNTKEDLCPVVNDSPLTLKGRKQELAFVDVFKKYGVEKTYYSPKQRTKGIGEILDKTLKIPHEVLEDLSERNWGDWGPQPWKEVRKKLDKLSIEERYTLVPPNGESWQQFEKRFFKALDKIKGNDHRCVAIITHKGSLRAGLPILNKVNIDKHKEFNTDLGSITIFNVNGDKYELEKFNYVPEI